MVSVFDIVLYDHLKFEDVPIYCVVAVVMIFVVGTMLTVVLVVTVFVIVVVVVVVIVLVNLNHRIDGNGNNTCCSFPFTTFLPFINVTYCIYNYKTYISLENF